MLAAKTQSPRSKSAQPAEKTKSSAQPPAVTAFNPAWARLALGIQPKLAVSAPGDPAEQEADRIADTVMRMPEPTVQRKCAACSAGGATCPSCEEEEHVQRKADGADGAGEVGSDFASHLGGGTPIDADSRAFFEPRFGRDFGDVRLHTDAQAADLARSVGARAFALGRNVVFAAGEYAPRSDRGRGLLAHELVHTVQQSNGPAQPTTLQRQTPPSPTPTPAPAPTPAQQQCTTALTATTAEAVSQLTRAVDALLTFSAAEVYPYDPADPRVAEHRRIAAHLSALFATTDALDVQAIAFRLGRLRRALSGGEVNMSCSTGCGGGGAGGSVLLGFSPTPFNFVLCAVGAPPASLARVMIHECAHAVLPDVGVNSRPTMAEGTGVLDRAYNQERLFTHLSTTEAMTNAESYSDLVAGINSGGAPPAAAGATDTVTGCADRNPIETALGRAQQAARLATNWLEAAARQLAGSSSTAVSSLTDPGASVLQRLFPRITTLAQLQSMSHDAGVVYTNFINPERVDCGAPATWCPAGRLAFADLQAITSTAVQTLPRQLNQVGGTYLCPAWFTASDAERNTTMFVAVALGYLGGATIQILRPADAMNLANFAFTIANRYLPPPVAHTATEHLSQ